MEFLKYVKSLYRHPYAIKKVQFSPKTEETMT